MVKNLNLIGNSTASLSVRSSIHPSTHPSGADTPWCRNVLVPNRQGELTSLVPKRLGAETSRAESFRYRNDLVPKRL